MRMRFAPMRSCMAADHLRSATVRSAATVMSVTAMRVTAFTTALPKKPGRPRATAPFAPRAASA
jgi:hypothetical protein